MGTVTVRVYRRPDGQDAAASIERTIGSPGDAAVVVAALRAAAIEVERAAEAWAAGASAGNRSERRARR